jgi:hypothetical protein
MAVRLSAPRTGRTLLPRNIIFIFLMFPVLIPVRGWVNPRTWCCRKDYYYYVLFEISARRISQREVLLDVHRICGCFWQREARFSHGFF